MHKQIANKILNHLDSAANHIEKLAKTGKIDPKVASEITRDIDTFSDRIEKVAFGEGSFNARRAKVIQRDPDEKFMDTYDAPSKVIQSDADEGFMHKTEPSFNSKSIDTFDADRTTQVTDRNEYNVRDVSDMSDGTKKQPSWTKGPAGNSTKQGSTRSASGKTWAP
jgi:hypothetical protein